jgi:hypothetical protein
MIRLLLALIAVESNGNDAAVGDQGRAVGCLQIHARVVEDVNRVYGTQFRLSHRWDREQSLRICELYLAHYAARVPGPVTWETYARIWNGGPSGHQKEATAAYWAKVQAELNRPAY